MKKDAHYYALLALCRICGFTKECSLQIAHASQFVDDAKINLIYISNPERIADYEIINGLPALSNMATSHSYFKINNFNYESMVYNTCAFHFVPGAKGENFTKKMRCQEESAIVSQLLRDTLEQNDLIKLGMVLHAYADTFAHQGFSGILSKVNDISYLNTKNQLHLGLIDQVLQLLRRVDHSNKISSYETFIPAYGHGLALDFPDLPYLIWRYQYDKSEQFYCSFTNTEVDNPARYRRAFEKIKTHLVKYISTYPEYQDAHVNQVDMNLFFRALLLENTDRMRELNWQTFLIEHGLFKKEEASELSYKDDLWLKEAFVNYDYQEFAKREVQNAYLSENFSQSNWYRFYKAVQWYKKTFFQYAHRNQMHIPR